MKNPTATVKKKADIHFLNTKFTKIGLKSAKITDNKIVETNNILSPNPTGNITRKGTKITRIGIVKIS